MMMILGLPCVVSFNLNEVISLSTWCILKPAREMTCCSPNTHSPGEPFIFTSVHVKPWHKQDHSLTAWVITLFESEVSLFLGFGGL